MKGLPRTVASAPLLVLALAGCRPTLADRPPPPTPPSGAPQALPADVAATLDPSVDPCTDFYRYACGGWLASTELTPDAPIKSRSLDHIETVMQDLERMVSEPSPEGGAADPVLRYYRACMDTDAIEAAAPAAIAELLALVGEPKDPASSARALAQLALAGISTPLSPFVAGDPSRPGHAALYLDQGGLALEPQAYADPALVDEYQALVALTLAAAGEPDPEARAADVVAIERHLAANATPLAEERAAGLSAPRTTAELEAAFPGVPWRDYLDALGQPDLQHALVLAPTQVAAVGPLLRDTPRPAWRAYLRWLALRSYADALTPALAQAHFAFFGGRVLGQQEPRPRAFRCVEDTLSALPDAVDQRWLAERWSDDAAGSAHELSTQIHAALEHTLGATSWLDAPTRAEALRKARAVGLEIGHPRSWPTADDLVIGDGFVVNQLAANRALVSRSLAQAGRALDPDAWRVPAITVGAFYDPTVNEMLLPAGILQPPYFMVERPMAMNFGAIGVVIGHELTHAFDDRGRRTDADHESRDWWSEASDRDFEARAACVEDYYGRYEAAPGQPLDGARVRSEAIADLGGLGIAFAAYQRWAREHDVAPQTLADHGLTHAELFFVAYAQQECQLVTPQLAAERAAWDVHPPPAVRINASLANTPEFWSTFGCEPGDAMRPANACEVW